VRALIVSQLFLLLFTACTGTQKNDFSRNASEQQLYATAQNHLQKRRFILAIETLNQLEADYPFGKYADSAQLSLIYAYYKSDELSLADAAASRFIRLNPNHTNVDYAYYMRGLAAFPKPTTLFQSFFGSDLSKRDMQSPQMSFVHFSELAKRFPNSQYAGDTLKRMEYLRNLFARYEIHIANYYLRRGAFLAAINRGKFVLENYQKTPAVPDALAILVQGYQALDMNELSNQHLAVLRLNYPRYPALKQTATGGFDFHYAKRQSKSLVRLLTFGLIDISPPTGFDTRKQYGS